MADYNVKSMGDALDSMCSPADACRSPIDLKENDLFYDPSYPGKIMHLTGSPLVPAEYTTLQNGNTIINEASGLQYHYDENDGIVFDGFAWGNKTYIIQGVIPYNVTMPEKCTLIFEGGKFTGSLTGNYTTIEAGPIQIFDVGIAISGSFTNEYAYPEWWGAVATKSTASGQPNCRASIQAALDSIFGEIRFCPGFYCLKNPVSREGHEEALLYLNYTKTLKLSGNSHNFKGRIYDGATSVLWTEVNTNILLINVKKDYPIDTDGIVGRTLIKGGEFNASKCPDFSHSAILVYVSGTEGLRIETSLCGPIGDLRNDSGSIDWTQVHCPTSQELDAGYKGYGIKFTNNTHISSTSHCYLTRVDSYIYGFGTGFAVQYHSNPYLPNTPIYELGNMTSMELRGYIDNCFRYIYAPSRAFNGGVVKCVIQTREQNSANDGFAEPIIQGNFLEAYLDPMVWDLHQGIDALRLTSSSKNIRLGQRLLGVLRSRYHFYRFGENISDPTRAAGIRSLAALTSADSGSSMGVFGNFDLLGLAGVNAVIQSANYVHVIDNDLLSIDSMVSGFTVSIIQNGFTAKYSSYNGIHKPDTSPFDRDGIVFAFNEIANNTSAFIQIGINFPISCQKPLEFLALHLKGSTYNHFTNLKVEMTSSNDSMTTLFDGGYASVQMDDNRSDIILPIIFKDGQNRTVKSLLFRFTSFVYKGDFWGTSGANEDFKFSIEGRYNRHYNHQVFTSSGGSIGKHIMRLGKPYLLGTGNYPTFSDLPANASPGAIGLLANTYPVVMTPNGWMIQNLVGSTSDLVSLRSAVGGFSVGQMAFNTTLSKPVWWNGVVWVDATGSAI